MKSKSMASEDITSLIMIARVCRILRWSGRSGEIDEYRRKAIEGDFIHALHVTMEYVSESELSHEIESYA